GEAYGINLQGIEQESSIALLKFEASQRGIQRVASAKESELVNLHEILGGSPLAIKLVVCQLRSLTLEDINSLLSGYSHKSETEIKSEYEALFNFIFRTSWNLLSLAAKKMLLCLAVYSPEEGAS